MKKPADKIYRGCLIQYCTNVRHYKVIFVEDGNKITSNLSLSTTYACKNAIDSLLKRHIVEEMTFPKKEELPMRQVVNTKTKDVYNNIHHACKEMGMSLSWAYNQLGKSKRSKKLLQYAA